MGFEGMGWGKETVDQASQRPCSMVIQDPLSLPSKKSGFKTHGALVWPSGCVIWNPLFFCFLASACHQIKAEQKLSNTSLRDARLLS